MELTKYTELIRAESREQIGTLNHLLLELEADPTSPRPVEGIFRAVHTIKGTAATMGYLGVAELAHEMESLLDSLRQRRIQADAALIELFFRATDALETGIEAATSANGAVWDGTHLVEELRAIPHGNGADADAAGEELRVRVVVDAASPLPAARAFMALQRAREAGVVSALEPAESALQDGSFAGSLTFLLRSTLSAAEIHQRLEKVGELASLEVERVLLRMPLEGAADEAQPIALPRLGERHVRVEADRLDTVLDRIGELVILRDRLLSVAAARDQPELSEPVAQMARLIGELRDDVLRIRMVPVREVFDRFPRLVRDAARALSKQVEFAIEGLDIELDRSVLDRVVDPLIHLLRNAVDHGIETPDERRARGKPETARLRLSAQREQSRVLIRVEDDGRGVDRERVVNRAIQLGLIARDAAASLSTEDVFHLLTRPGLSTAARVTDVSGRGVGLDVVATRVRSLGGTLDITSQPGVGTVFALRLPVTVGIMRALLVRVGSHTYALPVAHVAETVDLDVSAIHGWSGKRVGVLRDEALPLVSLREILQPEALPLPTKKAAVVVLELEEGQLGVEVDAFVGQQEVVVKAFDGPRDLLPVFAGATILADGRPALILDVTGILRYQRFPGGTRVR